MGRRPPKFCFRAANFDQSIKSHAAAAQSRLTGNRSRRVASAEPEFVRVNKSPALL
jgi:hypothetical protein